MAATETKGTGRGRGAGASGVGRKEAESWRERVMTGRGSSHRWLRTGTRRGRDENAPYGKRRRERGGTRGRDEREGGRESEGEGDGRKGGSLFEAPGGGEDLELVERWSGGRVLTKSSVSS